MSQSYGSGAKKVPRHKGDRRSPVSSLNGSIGYYEDDGGDQLAYNRSEEYDSGFSDPEILKEIHRLSTGSMQSYIQAKNQLAKNNRYETVYPRENEETNPRSHSDNAFNQNDMERGFRPIPNRRLGVPNLLDSMSVPSSPPQAKPRGRSRSLDNLDFRNVPLPGEKTPFDIIKPVPNRPASPRPGSPRHQIVNNLAGGAKVADIVNAINRSRPSSPELGSPESNWIMTKKQPDMNIKTPDANIDKPAVAPRKISRQENLLENDRVGLGVRNYVPNRRHSFDSRGTFVVPNRSDRRSSEDSHLYEHLQHIPVISTDTRRVDNNGYEQVPALAPPKVAEWINNQPDNIPDIIEPEPVLEPDRIPSPCLDDDRMSNYRRPSTAGTGRSRVSTASMANAIGLTVAPVVDDTDENTQKQDTCSNFYIVATKWFAAILVSLIVLACVTFNKICLLTIGRAYAVSNDGNNTAISAPSKMKGYKESIVLMLILILMIPQAFSFLIALWGKKRSQPWPSKSAVILIIVGGIVESSCLSYLCIYAITILSSTPHVFLLFMSGLFVVPTIIQVYESARRYRTTNGKRRAGLFVLAAVLQISGLVLLFIMNQITELRDQIGIPLAIFLLSIAWSPKLRRLQTQSSELRNPIPSFPRSTATPDDFQSVRSMESLHSNISTDDYEDPLTKRSAREKAALAMSLVHLIMTPIASIIFCLVFNVAEISDFDKGFELIDPSHPVFYFFLAQIFLTFFGYHAAWLACSMYTQRVAFALPLTLATPLAMIFIQVQSVCNTPFIPLACGPQSGNDLYYLIGTCALLLLGQFLSTGYYVWANKGYIMGKASHLFWLPSYTGAFLEPFLLLNRRNKVTDQTHVTSKQLTRKTHVFICSTMYHEELYEMEQLLESLHDIDNNMQKGKRHVESHIFFDDAVKAELLNPYVLQLATIVRKTLKVELKDARKIRTPYGLQVTWKLPGGLPITIHMKDNSKVKNKKRWSQVMYMSYVIDYKQRYLGINDDQTFILTTDADVNFTHDSMEALIDYMVQDDKIGAVCGRTHPMGNGPMVWYQIFDYAVGHWFMKVANHVFGSVLCCPGCFSLYRCKAVRSVLREYSSNVNEAFEFLTKDMGEDRWFCTLMVQNGWRLAYCAAAEDRTYCPQEFEEFYKQRRRWMPSTLANLALLISRWRTVLNNNENISFPFIIYQVILLLATLIGPSIVILFIVGGLVSLSSGNEEAIVIVFSVLTIFYAFVCLFFTQDTQIKLAKLLTFVFAIIMILVTIGLCVQIEREVSKRKNLNITDSTPLEQKLPADVSSLYLGGLVAIFIVSAMMHPKEALCLMNGIWYLLCLPSGYLLLTIYSIANMTDRSWGTREAKTGGGGGSAQSENPFIAFWNLLKDKFSCCLKCCEKTKDTNSTRGKSFRRISTRIRNRVSHRYSRKARIRHGSKEFDSESISSEGTGSIHSTKKHRIKKSRHRLPGSLMGGSRRESDEIQPPNRSRNIGKPLISITVPEEGPLDYNEDMGINDKFGELSTTREGVGALGNRGFEPDHHRPGTILEQEIPPEYGLNPNMITDDDATSYMYAVTTISMEELLNSDITVDTTVEEWLKGELRPYVFNFKKHGYDTIAFISGMSKKELEDIGITVRGHQNKLHRAITKLPTKVIEEGIPVDVAEWLEDLNLLQYWPNFVLNFLTEPNDLEDLKNLSKEDMKKELKIEKVGHLNMLWKAVQKLQYANQEQQQISQARIALESVIPETLEPAHENDPALEYYFWEALRETCLKPQVAAFSSSTELKEKLAELRNSVLTIFFVSNALWMVVIMVLVKQSQLKALGVDVIGLSFLFTYGAVTLLQFFAMITHRLTTLLHILARTPWICCGNQVKKIGYKDGATVITQSS